MSIYNNFIVDIRNNKGHQNDFFLISNIHYTVNSEVNGLLIKKTITGLANRAITEDCRSGECISIVEAKRASRQSHLSVYMCV